MYNVLRIIKEGKIAMETKKIGRPKEFKKGVNACVRMEADYKEYLRRCARNESVKRGKTVNLSLLIREAVEKCHPNNGTLDMFDELN